MPLTAHSSGVELGSAALSRLPGSQVCRDTAELILDILLPQLLDEGI